MVLFGEIVIPSTRALLDCYEEIDQFTDGSEIYVWDGDSTIPDEINDLLLVQTKKLTDIARTCIAEDSNAICKINGVGVSIWQVAVNNYLVMCEESQDIIEGEVIDMLRPWIVKAKRIFVITSSSVKTFLSSQDTEMSVSMRCLTTGDVRNVYGTKLEAPNMITGISAGVLSYCQHISKPASLYIFYFDLRPLDSTTAGPVLQLFKQLNIQTQIPFSFKKPMLKFNSNLYM